MRGIVRAADGSAPAGASVTSRILDPQGKIVHERTLSTDRFGAALKGSRTPHPYRSHFIDDVAHLFTSRKFGQPGYAQLSESAPLGLLTGARNGSEIGAFSSLLNPIRLDGLRAKADEYMPFGLIPVFVFET